MTYHLHPSAREVGAEIRKRPINWIEALILCVLIEDREQGTRAPAGLAWLPAITRQGLGPWLAHNYGHRQRMNRRRAGTILDGLVVAGLADFRRSRINRDFVVYRVTKRGRAALRHYQRHEVAPIPRGLEMTICLSADEVDDLKGAITDAPHPVVARVAERGVCSLREWDSVALWLSTRGPWPTWACAVDYVFGHRRSAALCRKRWRREPTRLRAAFARAVRGANSEAEAYSCCMTSFNLLQWVS